MWGQLLLEKNLTTNYQFGFPTDSSLMIVNLSQWQYWWWFWFTTYLILYWFIIIRIIRYRTLAFKPRIATTFRPHGKWGDLIICIIPISWCFNILNHSNMLLRTMEWQTETSLFNVRIVGRQWFWIYKYDLKIITDIMSAPRNVGHNKWELLTPTTLKTANNYLRILQIRNETNWNTKYWTENSNELPNSNVTDFLVNKTNTNKFTDKLNKSKLETKWFIPVVKIKVTYASAEELKILKYYKFSTLFNKYQENVIFNQPKNFVNISKNLLQFPVKPQNFTEFKLKKLPNIKSYIPTTYLKEISNTLTFIDNNQIKNHNMYSQNILPTNKHIISEYNEEFIRWFKFTQNSNLPVRIIKTNLTNLHTDLTQDASTTQNLIVTSNNLLKIRYNNTPNQYLMRNNPRNNFFVFQQNRLKKKKFISSKLTSKIKYKSSINFNQEFFNLNNNTNKKTLKSNLLLQHNFFETIFTKKNIKINQNTYLYDTTQNINNNYNVNTNFKLLKQYKLFSDNYNSMLSKRLLRTKKILVLPAHVNLTLITNSYDVTHSWFIPALAVKLDCVPGRSTHHILHIENVGLYYGQCAEICGRYHHHMPIRVCALPFDHFLIWWHSFGLPSLLYTKTNKKYSSYYGFRKYYW